MRQLESSANSVTRTVGNTMKNVALAGTAATTVVGVATAAAITSSARAAGNVEQQLANTAAVLQKSMEEVAPLKNLIGELAINPDLRVNAVQAGEAINMLARNGLDMTEILSGAAEATVLLANATNDNFATAADVATDAMSQFGIEAENMMDAVNGIVSVTNNSKLDIDDYRLAIGQAGAIADATGVSFEDFNATLAATASAMNSGSDAGTSFRSFLQSLTPGTNPAVEAMERLGLASVNVEKMAEAMREAEVEFSAFGGLHENLSALREELGLTEDQFNTFALDSGILQTAFFDASGQMKSMAEIAGALTTAMAGLSEQQRTTALETIFGPDGGRTAVALARMTREEFEELQATLSQTDAMESAAVRMDTFNGALDVLGGTIEAIKIGVGQEFLPLFTQMTNSTSRFLTTVAPRIQTFASDFVSSITDQEGVNIAELITFDLDDSISSNFKIGDIFKFEKLTFNELVDGSQTNINLGEIFSFTKLEFADVIETSSVFSLGELFQFERIAFGDLVETNIAFDSGNFTYSKIAAEDYLETNVNILGLFDSTSRVSADEIFEKTTYAKLFTSESTISQDQLFGTKKWSLGDFFSFERKFSPDEVIDRIQIGDFIDIEGGLFGQGGLAKVKFGDFFDVDFSQDFKSSFTDSQLTFGELFDADLGLNFKEGLTSLKLGFGDIFDTETTINLKESLFISKFSFGDIVDLEFDFANFKINKMSFSDILDFSSIPSFSDLFSLNQQQSDLSQLGPIGGRPPEEFRIPEIPPVEVEDVPEPGWDWMAIPSPSWPWEAIPSPAWNWEPVPSPGWDWPSIPEPGWLSKLRGPTGGGGGGTAAAQALGGDVRRSGVYRFNEFGQEAVLHRGQLSFPEGDYAYLPQGSRVITNRELRSADPIDYSPSRQNAQPAMALAGTGNQQALHFHFNAPIYGVNDLENTIRGMMNKARMRR